MKLESQMVKREATIEIDKNRREAYRLELERESVGKEKKRNETQNREICRQIAERDRRQASGIVIALLCYNLILTAIWSTDHTATFDTIPLWLREKLGMVARLIENGKNMFAELSEQTGQAVANLIFIVASLIVFVIMLFVMRGVVRFIGDKIYDCRTDGAELFKISVQVSTFFAFCPISVYLYEAGVTWLKTDLLPLWGVLGALAVVVVTLCIKSHHKI